MTDDVLGEFKQFLAKENIPIAGQDFQDNLDFIKQHIQLQLITVIYGENEASQISVTNDYLVQKALESLPQARELLSKAKKYMASKTTK